MPRVRAGVVENLASEIARQGRESTRVEQSIGFSSIRNGEGMMDAMDQQPTSFHTILCLPRLPCSLDQSIRRLL